METRLTELSPGKTGVITTIEEDGRSLSGRLRDLGFTENTPVACVRSAPLCDPVAYRIRGTLIALRKKDAACILVHSTGGEL